MTEPAPRTPRRGLRRLALLLSALFVLGLVIVFVVPWWFDARRIAGLALEQADAATGLSWSFEGEPELRWRPKPWIALPGLVANDADGRRLLAARRLELALPWATLRGESLRIEAIRVVAPEIDLDVAMDWWASRPAGAEETYPVLDGLDVTEGRVTQGALVIDRLALTMPRFALGEAFGLRLAARVLPNADATPFDVEVALEARAEASPLRLERLHLEASGTGPMPRVMADGRVQFSPWQMVLGGEIAAWPDAWPPLPAPLSASATALRFTAQQGGEGPMAAPLALDIRRDETHLAMTAAPAALLAWIDDPDRAALPPMRLEAAAPALEIEGARLEGVRFSIEEAPHEPDAGEELP